MAKRFYNKESKIKSWITVAVCSLSIFCLVFFLGVDYKRMYLADAYSNAFFASGTLTLFGLLFVFIRRKGTFDILEYSFMRLGESFKKGSPKKYDSAADYAEAKKEKRENSPLYFWPYLIVGISFIILAAIMALVYEGQMSTLSE